MVSWVTVTFAAIPTRRFHTQPGFGWPESERATYAANRLPKEQILAFLAAGLGWSADDMPSLADFRFAKLGPKEICLVAGWGLRHASQNEVICPAAGGGYWDTSLGVQAPAPLAWYVVDLDGDGTQEVISSEDLNLPVPTYWYEIYSFRDGEPRSVSDKFPQFYKAALLPRLFEVDRLIAELFPGEPAPAKARYARMVLLFTQLKYQRRILGDPKAGLEQGLKWLSSPYANVQGLGLETLAEIRDPRSISALGELGRSTRNQGVCVGVVNALAALEGRAPGGIISDSNDIQKIQTCDAMKPEPARLLQ